MRSELRGAGRRRSSARQGGSWCARRRRSSPRCATASPSVPAPPPRAAAGALRAGARRGREGRPRDRRPARRSRSTARDKAVGGRQGEGLRGRPTVDGDHVRVQHGADAGRRRRSARAQPRRRRRDAVAPRAGCCSRSAWPGPRSPPRSGACSRARSSSRSPTSPRRPSTSPPPRTSPGGSTPAAATRWGGWRRASTRCSTRSRARSQAQRRLVADASHELRTPVTSLRTNIEVLLAGEDLPEPARRRLLEDVREQTEELSGLITDVIELARGDVPLSGTEDVRLDEIAAGAAGRVGRSHPDVRFELDLEPSVVEACPTGSPARSATCSTTPPSTAPPGGVVEVRCAAARSPCATTARACRRRGAVRVRSLLPRRRRPRAPGLGPRAGDRAPGRRGPRRRRDGRGGAGRRRALPPPAAG